MVRQTLAYAAGMAESEITDSTGMLDLGIDSVAMMASKVVLEAELDIQLSDTDLVKVFEAGTVAEAIALVKDHVVNGPAPCTTKPCGIVHEEPVSN